MKTENDILIPESLSELIEFYESKDNWCVGDYERDGHYCALGHLGLRAYPSLKQESLIISLKIKFMDFGLTSGSYINLAEISDGFNEWAEYASTPKERVLKYLRSKL